MKKIEICANSLQSAIFAQKGGADRIELCDNLLEGGTTPSWAIMEQASQLEIEVYVLIRPRGGDFCYNDAEFEAMIKDIEIAKNLGMNGIVSGVLDENQSLDVERTQALIQKSKPLPFTFHRAFDVVPNPLKTLEQLIALGAKRVLTSGQKNTAIEGANLLKQLVEKAEKDLTILVGGGITKDNIEDLMRWTQAQEYHLSAKSVRETVGGFPIYETDEQKVKEVVELVRFFDVIK